MEGSNLVNSEISDEDAEKNPNKSLFKLEFLSLISWLLPCTAQAKETSFFICSKSTEEQSLGFLSITQLPRKLWRAANLHVSIILQTNEVVPLQAADICTHLYCKFTIETLLQAFLHKKKPFVWLKNISTKNIIVRKSTKRYLQLTQNDLQIKWIKERKIISDVNFQNKTVSTHRGEYTLLCWFGFAQPQTKSLSSHI